MQLPLPELVHVGHPQSNTVMSMPALPSLIYCLISFTHINFLPRQLNNTALFVLYDGAYAEVRLGRGGEHLFPILIDLT